MNNAKPSPTGYKASPVLPRGGGWTATKATPAWALPTNSTTVNPQGSTSYQFEYEADDVTATTKQMLVCFVKHCILTRFQEPCPADKRCCQSHFTRT
jgi:hypothetical protein